MLKKNVSSVKTVDFNFGPQHPAAHGVLRLMVKLKNEVIVNCDPHIGLLHRGTEYLIETKPYYLSTPYFDRLDYVSTLNQEHAYCLAVENVLGYKTLPQPVEMFRTVLDELTRVLNHTLAIACHALDVGSMSPIFWLFEERENIMSLYEGFSGARMHTALYRPVTGNRNFGINDISLILKIITHIPTTINEVNSILTNNKIWKARLTGIGKLDLQSLVKFGLTGVMARSAGLKTDARLNNSYSYYRYIKFNGYSSSKGDSLARYTLRMYEIIESIGIANTTLTLYLMLPKVDVVLNRNLCMEETLSHFKLWSGLSHLVNSIKTSYIESPKGLFGVALVTNNTTTPVRCKIRSPSYNNLFWLKQAARGLFLSDLIVLIGTVDIVFGEIDR